MSYDIRLRNRKTNQPEMLQHPFYLRAGTVRAEVNPHTGKLVQAKETEACINITYNYGRYYREAADGDSRFVIREENGDLSYGIRGIYGKTPEESIPMLLDLVSRITAKYQGPDGDWLVTDRVKQHYFDPDGHEVADPMIALLHKVNLTIQEEPYQISEGDMSNYWEATAANAIAPLLQMVHMAVDCFACDCVWDGD